MKIVVFAEAARDKNRHSCGKTNFDLDDVVVDT